MRNSAPNVDGSFIKKPIIQNKDGGKYKSFLIVLLIQSQTGLKVIMAILKS